MADNNIGKPLTMVEKVTEPDSNANIFINDNGKVHQAAVNDVLKNSDINTSLSDKGYLSFDIITNKQVIKGHLNNSGEIETSIAYLCSDYIEIKPNIKYVLGYSKGITQYTVAFYDSNKKFILRESSGQRTDRPKSYDFSTPSNAKYVRIDIGWYGGGVELPISEASFMTLYQYVYDNTEIGVIKNTLDSLISPTVDVLGSVFTNTSYENMSITNINNYRSIQIILRNSNGMMMATSELNTSVFSAYCTSYQKALSAMVGENIKASAYFVNNTTLQVVCTSGYSGIVYGIK